MKLEYVINSKNNYENLRQILKEEFKLSNRLILKLKNFNQIYLNNSSIHNLNQNFQIGDRILVNLDFSESCDNIVPIKMDLDILFEDESLLIVNKPPFVPVHPSLNHFEDSLSNGIKYYFETIGLKRKIRPINRLDKNTSGIVLFAKNQYIQECLIHQMANGAFNKEYLAIINGNLNFTEKIIDAPIARKEKSIIERCVSQNGDNAITIVNLIKNFNNFALVNCILKTGRTHQIRVHLSYIDHPILGDDLYGEKSDLINRQALHAQKINFVHPITNKKIEIICDLPEDMKKIISLI